MVLVFCVLCFMKIFTKYLAFLCKYCKKRAFSFVFPPLFFWPDYSAKGRRRERKILGICHFFFSFLRDLLGCPLIHLLFLFGQRCNNRKGKRTESTFIAFWWSWNDLRCQYLPFFNCKFTMGFLL